MSSCRFSFLVMGRILTGDVFTSAACDGGSVSLRLTIDDMHTRRKDEGPLSEAVFKRADHFERVGVVESLFFSESLSISQREECLLLFCISRNLYYIHPITAAVVGENKITESNYT